MCRSPHSWPVLILAQQTNTVDGCPDSTVPWACLVAFSFSRGPCDTAWATFQLSAHLGLAYQEGVGYFHLAPAGPPHLDNPVHWPGRCWGSFLFFFFFCWEMPRALGRNNNSRKQEDTVDRVRDRWRCSRKRAQARVGGGHVPRAMSTCL